MSVLIEPGHVTEYPLNHARILYGNAITAATATGARAKFPASAALTETTYERWSPAESGDSITLTFPDQNINAIALAAHSGLQPVIEVRQGGAFIPVTAYPYPLTDGGPALVSDFAAGDYQLYSFSPDNQAILFLLKPRRIDAIRITVTYSGTAPTLGVVRAGNVLEMARPFYQGHNPAILAADNTLRPNVSESGEWLGASLIRQGRSVKMDWQNLASSWIREKWTPFSKTIKTSPFIIAWNPKKFSTDVFYCSSSDTPQPTHSGPRDLMAVSLSARGYSDGTEPEVLNLANSTFDNLFTFTRASAATITDIDGTLREVGVDVPRLVQYDGEGNALGLLIEEQRTNHWTQNTDLTGADGAGSVTLASSHEFGNFSFRLEATTAGQVIRIQEYGVPYSEGTRKGAYVKAGELSVIDLSVYGGSTTTIRFYLLTQQVDSLDSNNRLINPMIEDFGGGWFRISIEVGPELNGAYTRFRIYGLGDDGGTANIQSGDGFYLALPQIEEATFSPLSSPIITNGTQVTRAADSCVRVLGDEFNPDEGSVYWEGEVLGASHYSGLFSIATDSDNRLVDININANTRSIQFSTRLNGDYIVSNEDLISSPVGVNRVCVSYS